MDALTYVTTKWELERDVAAATPKRPVEIPNTNRETLARLFYLLGFQSGAEVGVERGHYSEVLCQQNPGVRLLCVDAWQAYRGYRDHVRQAKLDRFYAETAARLAPYKATLVRQFSTEAAKDVPDGSLDFVYIDGNHNIENVIADLAAWSPKVRPGGIVAGHDFLPHRWPNQMHVVQALHAWTDAYDIRPWFVLGRKEKRPGELRDDGRSWFYVHEPRPVLAHGRRIHQ